MQLEGDLVVLRPLADDDVDALVSMFAEPAVSPWWPRYDRAMIQDDLLDPDDEQTVFAITVGGAIAGIIECFEEADPDYKQASIDIALATRWHGRGVATDALRTLAHHLIDDLGHHHLTIDPAVANERAISAYEKVGFKRVGVLRQNERGADGTFHDALMMDLLPHDLT